MFRLVFKAFYRVVNYLIFFTNFYKKSNSKQIVLESLPDYSDNAKALSDYLIQNGQGLHIIWLVDNPEQFQSISDKITFLPRKTKFNEICHNTLKTVLNCRYIMSTHGFTVKKEQFGKRDQVYIRLWHGCGYKANERKVKSEPDFNYTLVPGKAFIQSKAKFWNVTEDYIISLGLPRYDWFKCETNQNIIKNILPGVNDQSKIIIWLPTFRNAKNGDYPENTISDFPLIHSQSEWEQLDKVCKEFNVYILLKLHQFQMEYSTFDLTALENIHEISDTLFSELDINLYQFLTLTDALISDYSSVAVDYLLLDKPIAYILDDYELYKQARGFVFDEPLEYMPGYHVFTFDELTKFLNDVSIKKDPYKEKRDAVLPAMQSLRVEDNFSETIWNRIQELTGDQ